MSIQRPVVTFCAGVVTALWMMLAGFTPKGLSIWGKTVLLVSPFAGALIFQAAMASVRSHSKSWRLLLLMPLPLCCLLLWGGSRVGVVAFGPVLGMAGVMLLGQPGSRIGALAGIGIGVTLHALFPELISEYVILSCAVVSLMVAGLALTVSGARRENRSARWSDFQQIMAKEKLRWYCLFAMFAFGGLMALLSYQTSLWRDHYRLSSSQACTITTLCTIAAIALWLGASHSVKRVEGDHLLTVLFVGMGLMLLDLATMPSLVWNAMLVVLLLGALGLATEILLRFAQQQAPLEEDALIALLPTYGCVGGCLSLLALALPPSTGMANAGFVLLAIPAFLSTGALIHLPQSAEAPKLRPSRLDPEIGA